MDADCKNQFDRDGFIVLREFLTPAEIASMKEGWLRFVRDIAPGIGKAHVMYEDYDDPDTLKQTDCLHLEPSLDAWRNQGKVRELAEFLIGPVVPQQGEFFDKPPRKSKGTPPHQDGYYFCLKPNLACTVWIPLDTVDAENGALNYVRGSHRNGVLEHGPSSILGFSQGLKGGAPKAADHVMCAAQPGDVLVHHCLTIHYAGPNRSESRRRRSIGYVYFSTQAERDEQAWERYQSSLKTQREAKGIPHTEAFAG